MIQNYQVLIERLPQIKQNINLLKISFKQLETFDSIYFRSNFEDDGTQNWLVFQPIYRYFQTVSANDNNIFLWKSKILANESIKSLTTSNKMHNPFLDYLGKKAKVKFNRDYLKQEKVIFSHWKSLNN